MTEDTKKAETIHLKDTLRFRCAPGVPCFNECCHDVTIFLGPFDVLRLRTASGLDATEFLAKHAVLLGADAHLLPLVNLKIEGGDKACPFVTAEGCSVYQYRPWACRMFPIDVTEDGKGFKIIIDDVKCQGLRESHKRPVRDYLDEQGTTKYQVMDDLLGELVNDERFKQLDVENDQVKSMIFMALYDLDNFRRFVFESSFLEKFEIDDNRIKRLKRDDEELLRFGFEWLHFGLFGKRIFKVRDEVVEAAKAAEAEGEK